MFIIDQAMPGPVATFKIKEWERTLTRGTFYEQDLQKIDMSDDALFLVDRVLQHRRQEVNLRWKGWPYSPAECPSPQPKDVDGHDGTIGSQVRSQSQTNVCQEEEEEDEEEAPCQEEASLQEGPGRIPGQVSGHGQAWEERDLGHVLALVGGTVSPGRSYQTVQFVQ